MRRLDEVTAAVGEGRSVSCMSSAPMRSRNRGLSRRNKGLALLGFLLCPLGLAPQSWEVVIHEWDVPTPKSRPHDPTAAPDGALWYTGQLANKLGRLDPKTGTIKEFPLKTPDSGPHGLVADSQGNIWFTANFKAYIGKLNPRTGEVTEYRMTDERVKDPHSLIFDRDGKVLFTAQQSNFVGVLDPKSGRVSVQEIPTAKALPYGIILGLDGAGYFCEFGSNKIGKIDPKTLGITEFPLPEGARPRRLANNPDRRIYYSDFARGFLGRLDPQTGRAEEWPSPGGPNSQPYGIASTADGTVWYSEAGVQPNTLVAFDPRSKAFQSWPIPSGGGVVRNMVATEDGRLYLACSGVNKVAIAQVSH